MNILLKSLAMLVLIFSFSVEVNARTRTKTHGTIKMKSGNKIGLQNVYSWSAKCRSVKIRFRAGANKFGRVYKVRKRFKITRAQSRRCAGKRVSGFRVLFKAKRKAKGSTTISYVVKPANSKDTFRFRRRMKIR